MKHIFLFLTLCLTTSLFSQISVTQTESPFDLVNNLLTGNNVIISNLSYNGSSLNAQSPQTMIGHFNNNGSSSNNNGSSFPITEGIVMATGDAILAVGPNTTEITTNDNGVTIPDPSDPDLAAISSAVMNNECILEFDIIPTGDTLVFNYIFASEEYHTYSTSTFNDGFGFFISGPGISGPYTNGAENIATIPGTTLPVTINNLNNGYTNSGPCINCEFLIDNTNGVDVQYNAYTTKMQAFTAVQCGETYHIKLAIADAGDDNIDSGILIEANSFNANGSTVIIDQTSIIKSTCGNNDGSILINGLSTLNSYTYSIHNIDFSYSILNQNTGSFTNIESDLYSVIVCNDIGCKDSIIIPLSDQTLTSTIQSIVNVTCYNSYNGSITTSTIGGLSPYSYALYNSLSIEQGPQSTGNFSGLNGDNLFIETIDVNDCKHYLQVDIIEPDSLYTNTTIANNSCFGSFDGSYEIDVIGGTAPFMYSIDSGFVYQSNNLFIDLCSGTSTIMILDSNNCSSAVQFETIFQPDSIDLSNITITDPTCIGCCDGTLTLLSTGAIQFSIDNGATYQISNTFTNLCDSTFLIKTTNGNGCIDSTILIVGNSPIITNSSIENQNCDTQLNGSITLSNSGGIPPYTYIWNTGQITANLTNLDTGTYIITITDAVGTVEIDTFEVGLDFNLDTTLSQNQNILTANQSGAQYQWVDCEQNHLLIPNATDQIFEAILNGEYAVIITDGNCSDTSDCKTVENISIEEDVISNFKIFPNPSNGTVSINLSTPPTALITIKDINDKKIKSQIITSNAVIDISAFENGIYFITIKTKNQNVTKKISLIK
jgi:hypothetical protein